MKYKYILLFLICNQFLNAQSCWKSYVLSSTHCAAVKLDGTLWCWGRNNEGELGTGNEVNQTEPTQVGTSSDWREVFVSTYHSFAIKNDGSLWAWGANFNGALGDGSTAFFRYHPVLIASSVPWEIVANYNLTTLGIKEDGTLWAWGSGNALLLGTETSADVYLPVQIGTENDWTKVSIGYNHAMAIKTNGTLWGWGLNDYGQLSIITDVAYVPLQVGISNNWKEVSCGKSVTVATKTDGTIWASGDNYFGLLANGSASGSGAFLPR